MKNIIIIFFIIFAFFSCSEIQDWSDPKDSVPPGKVTDTQVENIYGGVRITYKLPSDKDVLGVKAVYELYEDGEKRETFSSAFRDTIEIHGFPDTAQRIVSLICVDKSQNESEPVDVVIEPLTPPVELIKQSLKATPAFGGIYLEWLNEMNYEISISISTLDSTEKYSLDETYYTKKLEDSYVFRGYDDSEQTFQIKIRDKWGNQTQSDAILKPFFEEEILARDEFGRMIFDMYGYNDGSWQWRGDMISQAGRWEKAFDGSTLGLNIAGFFGSNNTYWNGANSFLNSYVDDPNLPNSYPIKPLYCILDLGSEVKLSRHAMWMRGRDPGHAYLQTNHRYYQQGAPMYYEIWGTNELPKRPSDFSSREESLRYWTQWDEVGGTDAWKDDWVKLGDMAILPPSGARITAELTVEDCEYADNGFEVEISSELSDYSFRYIRFVFKELWDPTRQAVTINELKFFGSYAK